jgi:hypothetical protein
MVIEYLLVMLTAEQIFGEVWRKRRLYKTKLAVMKKLVVSLTYQKLRISL